MADVTGRGADHREDASGETSLRRNRFQTESTAALFQALESAPQGLSTAQAHRRLERYGPNALREARTRPLRKFLGYFWGPIAWMIEAAALLSALIRHWADLAIILVLLVFNGVVGFWEEFQAGNAIEQLKKTLAVRARVVRDGRWQELDARELVPGDVVRLHLGRIVPADIKLFEGDYLSVDQSALTGESLPVDKKPGDVAYSGSIARQGTMLGLVVATGMDTFFGETARLVGTAHPVSHFQKAVTAIGRYLISLSVLLAAVLIAVELWRHTAPFRVIEFALILTVASIPVAMPAVLSVTMAVGALVLSRMKAIVSRLESIEEMAGMDVLCSDKTGTLTQNTLTLGEPVCFGGISAQELILAGALASPLDDGDAIDLAVLKGLADPAVLGRHRQQAFVPFDPVRKRTEARVIDPQGRSFTVSKGAPQIILSLAQPDPTLQRQVQAHIDRFALQGDRALGVARSTDGQHWTFLGLLPLADPPRADAREVIGQAQRHGLRVKMVTGDNVAIARQIAARIGLGSRILPAESLAGIGREGGLDAEAERAIDAADGFAQVSPEHKFAIVQALQRRQHITGMTGDGVNDAPALRQAEVGIAVSGATDAARAAAAVVLTEPGLGVIIRAVEEARRIFERMTSYAIYRITETLRIMLFVVLAIMVYRFFPITPLLIILLALLNDLPILTIAYDHAALSPVPVRWDMRRVLAVASVLGLIGVVETFGLMVIALHYLRLTQPQLQSLIFLKLAVAGHLTLWVARTRERFFQPPWPAPVLLAAVLCTQSLAAMIVGFGWLVVKIPWLDVGLVWAYALAWIFIEDELKLRVYRALQGRGDAGGWEGGAGSGSGPGAARALPGASAP